MNNEDHIELMARICWSVNRREGWGGLDALLFPAAFYLTKGRYGALTLGERLSALSRSEVGRIARASARKLRASSPGSVVVVGIDTPPRKHWRGDMMVAAFSTAGPVAVTQMIYPVKGDRTVLWTSDADTPGRLLTLRSGATAVLCVCYDAFALGELASNRLGGRANLSWIGQSEGKPRRLANEETVRLLRRLQHQLKVAAPTVALIAIHRFQRPGADLLWQRHGISTASASLQDGLAVGASHYLEQLPSEPSQSPLASYRVSPNHLDLGVHRPARAYPPLDGFYVSLPLAPQVQALVRVYQTR